MKVLSICVLHYNNEDLTNQCIESIEADPWNLHYDIERIIIDNGSEKPYPERGGWRIKHVEKNVGNIGGQNIAFESAQANKVVFVSNDVIVLTDCIRKLSCVPISAMHMPSIYTPDRFIETCGLKLRWPAYVTNIKKQSIGSMPHTDYYGIPGIIYCTDKDLWRSVGGFDETFISSHEDIDFSMKAERMGFVLKSIKSAKAVHLGNQTLGKLPYYNRKLIHEARVKLIKKHFSGLDKASRLAAVNTIDKLTGAY